MPAGAIYVGRPSRWGNPFTLNHRSTDPDTPEVVLVRDRDHAVDLFWRWWLFWLTHADRVSASSCRSSLEELRGRHLACWCALDSPCHAAILIDLANRPLP